MPHVVSSFQAKAKATAEALAKAEAEAAAAEPAAVPEEGAAAEGASDCSLDLVTLDFPILKGSGLVWARISG